MTSVLGVKPGSFRLVSRRERGGWLFPPVAKGRVAALRVLLYLFVPVDVLLTTGWVRQHGDVPTELYAPLAIGRLLTLPTPTPLLVDGVLVALLACALVAATGRLPRLAGTAVAVLYLEWMVIAFSYGKVDHDRFAFLVALAVLPTVGRARLGDSTADGRAGWAVRNIQLAVVATYVLAAVAKYRFGGGLEWLDSTTLLRAVVRRGTALADPLAEWPPLLHAAQYGVVALELASPLLLVRGRVGRAALWAAAAFHAVTFATITIIFLPHVLCLAAFLPLERAAATLRSGARHLAPRQLLVGADVAR